MIFEIQFPSQLSYMNHVDSSGHEADCMIEQLLGKCFVSTKTFRKIDKICAFFIGN